MTAQKGPAADQKELALAAGADAQPHAPHRQQLDLTAALTHMRGRSAFRQFYGAYDPARPGLSIALTMLLLVGCLLSAVYWTASGPVVVLSLQSPQVLGGWGGFNIISSLLVLGLLLFLSHKVRWGGSLLLIGTTRKAEGAESCWVPCLGKKPPAVLVTNQPTKPHRRARALPPSRSAASRARPSTSSPPCLRC
jgi:hypothetical protein